MPRFKTLPMPADGRAPKGYRKCTKLNCVTIDGADHCHEYRVENIVRMGCGVRIDLTDELQIECSAFMMCVDFPPEAIVSTRQRVAEDPTVAGPLELVILNVACAYLADEPAMVQE